MPPGIIVPGVIDTLTNIVEHPELVAERIERYANVVGRENRPGHVLHMDKRGAGGRGGGRSDKAMHRHLKDFQSL